VIDGTTRIVAVIGDPIEHTLSPPMHNAAFESLGMNWTYVAFHVKHDDVGATVESIRALNMAGINITVPHKQAVIPFLDQLTSEARAVGAVNTIINRDGHLIGDNTDIHGIREAIRIGAGLDPCPENVVLLGAGGAARGVAYALTTIHSVKHVTILNRTAEKAESLAAEFDGETRITGGPLDGTTARNALADAELVINVTSLGRGTYADQTPIPDEWDCLHPGITCIDSNYSPPVTRLMDQVESAGGKAFNGLDMLVFQGARSFELWTGVVPPTQVMKTAIGIVA
jgi:shikimate dehydrogenase